MVFYETGKILPSRNPHTKITQSATANTGIGQQFAQKTFLPPWKSPSLMSPSSPKKKKKLWLEEKKILGDHAVIGDLGWRLSVHWSDLLMVYSHTQQPGICTGADRWIRVLRHLWMPCWRLGGGGRSSSPIHHLPWHSGGWIQFSARSQSLVRTGPTSYGERLL